MRRLAAAPARHACQLQPSLATAPTQLQAHYRVVSVPAHGGLYFPKQRVGAYVSAAWD